MKPTRVRREFARMLCPVPAQHGIPCHHGPQGSPQLGTVPGIKKHVLFVHGREIYDKTEFPPTYAG